MGLFKAEGQLLFTEDIRRIQKKYREGNKKNLKRCFEFYIFNFQKKCDLVISPGGDHIKIK